MGWASRRGHGSACPRGTRHRRSDARDGRQPDEGSLPAHSAARRYKLLSWQVGPACHRFVRAEQVDMARRWLTEQAKGVNGDEKNPEFPGWMPDRGFFSALDFADSRDEELGQAELRQVLETRSQRDRFDAMLQLIEGKLQMLAERESPVPLQNAAQGG
jgi:hypothetical protein